MNTEIYKNKSLENLDGEIWKDIIGFEGLYQVSNLSRVKGLDRYVEDNRGYKKFIKEKILSQSNMRGYLSVTLSKNGILSTPKVHRLVVITFIPNINNKPFINHLDGCKTNNNISNLEFCTAQENIQHAYDNGLKIGKKDKEHPLFGKIGKENPSSKIIYQYTIQGDRELNINHSNISKCAKGKAKSSGGYFWSYQKIN